MRIESVDIRTPPAAGISVNTETAEGIDGQLPPSAESKQKRPRVKVQVSRINTWCTVNNDRLTAFDPGQPG